MPTTIEALVIIVLVLSPGYIFTQIARRVVAYVEEPTDTRVLLTIITAVFIMPQLLGIGLGRPSTVRRIDRLLDKVGLGYIDRLPSAWDFVMRQRRAGYVRIHLKDGKGIPGGIYARHSFGSTNPRQTELYLEELWQLDGDGNFEQPIPASRGVWIAREAIGYLAFLEGEDTPYDEEDRIGAGDVGVSRAGRTLEVHNEEWTLEGDTSRKRRGSPTNG